jgi:NADH:quinone reductase (non-electrogenic)
VAQPAMQMGDHVARIVAADLARTERPAFHYFDKGDMATIGRKAAVARIQWPFRAHWSGLPAWFTWLTVHIWFLIGFRNRISVFAQWIWSYFTFTRSARLITGSQNLPGWPERIDKIQPQPAPPHPEPTSPEPR